MRIRFVSLALNKNVIQMFNSADGARANGGGCEFK